MEFDKESQMEEKTGRPEVNKTALRRTILYVFILAATFTLGAVSDGVFDVIGSQQVSRQLDRFEDILRLVQKTYVDAPDMDALFEGAVEGMLRSLDPHSVYIPPIEQRAIEEQYAGEFSGIGIHFEVRKDILTVVSPIPGTPADRMGLRAGDRIIEIDDVSAVGISNDEVHRRLRGPEGTKVKITVQRTGESKPFELILTRGRIPIHSIDAAFILSDGITGYIVINQFTSVTADELEAALRGLRRDGMKRQILDLRGNSGGYRHQAAAVADKFIEGGKIIATTRGRMREVSDTLFATDGATNPYLPLVVLVNRGSASASEIVAGAIQDHDRGLIIGQPTFGKGLVQLPFQMDDGAVVRITISRWYTPSGRCVQRSYDNGIGEYLAEIYREGHGEDMDSAAVDSSQVFFTRTGRRVYGGHGIHPDLQIDPGQLSDYGSRLLRERVLFEWAQMLAERIDQPEMEFVRFRDEWSLSRALELEFFDFAAERGIAFDPEGWRLDREFLLAQIKGELAQRLYNGRTFLWQILISSDAVVDSARAHMGEADELAKRSLLGDKG